jgi:hypothetical protein
MNATLPALCPLHRLRRSPSSASQGRTQGRGRPQRWLLPRLRGSGTMRSMVEGATPPSLLAPATLRTIEACSA